MRTTRGVRMPTDVVSVITATWCRPHQLARCMLSVSRQSYPHVEHVVVSDGPEPALRTPAFADYVNQLTANRPGKRIVVGELDTHDPDAWWGRRAKNYATSLATGSLFAWTDDDDELLQHHVMALYRALMRNPGAGFAFTKSHPDAPPEPTPGDNPGLMSFMARREVALMGPWSHTPYDGWEHIHRWLAAGVEYVHVPEMHHVIHRHDHYTPGDGYPGCEVKQQHMAMLASGQEVECGYCA